VTEPIPNGLPAGLALRRPRLDDLEEVAALCAAADLAIAGETMTSRDELRAAWGRERFVLERNAWLVAAGDRLVAYAWAFDSADHASIDGQFLVHPDRQWQGIEAPLLDWIERFAATLASSAADGRRVSLGVWCDRRDRRADLYRDAGFTHVRTFLRMRRALDDLPDDPLAYAPPPGLEVRRFVGGRDERAAWETSQDAFADHFRFHAQPFEEWWQEAPAGVADTDLWFVAWDGDVMAGIVIACVLPAGGYIDQLAVRRAWRRRGLGALLLLTTFSALRDRGCADATLGVDATNESGAVALYERVGMRRVLAHDFYEKVLRGD